MFICKEVSSWKHIRMFDAGNRRIEELPSFAYDKTGAECNCQVVMFSSYIMIDTLSTSVKILGTDHCNHKSYRIKIYCVL